VLDSVTVQGNAADWSGGVHIWGTGSAMLIKSWVENNSAANSGGGLGTNEGAALILFATTVYSNTAGWGGGLSAWGTTLLINSAVITNSAANNGGGIDLGVTGVLSVDTALMAGNTATYGGGASLAGQATLHRLTSTRNDAQTGGALAVYTSGALTLTASTVVTNTAGTGALYSAGRLVLEQSSVIRNSAAFGAGIATDGNAYLSNSTVSGNHAVLDGGGMYVFSGTVDVASTTIVSNTAEVRAGGIRNKLGGVVSMQNSILGYNSNTSGLSPDCSGPLVSLGYNLIHSTSDCEITGTVTGNLTGIAPDLAALADNGNAMLTHLPLPNSPVIDAANPSGCLSALGAALTVDQRHVARHLDGDAVPGAICDMGAVEFGAVLHLLFVPLVRK
jgi:hypothetical protein